MATARVHITRAMQHLSALPAGVLPSTTDDEPDMLLILNTMIGNWSERRSRADLMARGVLADIISKGQEAYALRAVMGQIASMSAKGAQVALTGSGARTALENVTSAIATALAATFPLDATMSAATAGLAITAPASLATYATITTDNSYTTGFDHAIQTSLALEIAAVYKRPVPDSLKMMAKLAYDAVMPPIPTAAG